MSKTLNERTLDTIKQAHDLVAGLNSDVQEATDKVAAFEADTNAAAPIADQIIEKLSSIRVDGELIVAPHLKDDFRSAMNSKEGMADLMNQLADIVVKNDAGTKTAGELGGAAASPSAYGEGLTSVSGSKPGHIRY